MRIGISPSGPGMVRSSTLAIGRGSACSAVNSRMTARAWSTVICSNGGRPCSFMCSSNTWTCGSSGIHVPPPSASVYAHAQRESFVVLRRYFVALLAVDSDAADVGHEDARLARHIRPDIPGVGGGIEGFVGHFVDVLEPQGFSFDSGFDAIEVVPGQVADAVRDPVNVLLDRDDHVAEHRRATRTRDDEQVGEASGGDAEIGSRTVGPLGLQRP